MEKGVKQKADDLVIEVVGNPDDWYVFKFSVDKLSKMVGLLGGKDLTRIYFLESLDSCLDYVERTNNSRK